MTLLTLCLLADTRVRVSSGDAQFLLPISSDDGTTEVKTLDNTSHGGKWLNIPAGSRVTVCAAYEKTDTFMLSIREPAKDGIEAKPYGVVLRQQSYDRVVAGCTPKDLTLEASAAPSSESDISSELDSSDVAVIGDELVPESVI